MLRFHIKSALICVCVVAGGTAGCSGQASDRSARQPRAVNVPANAPDTVPADATKDLYPVGSAVRDIVIILFEPHASLDARRRAIAAISGIVIGGKSRFPGEEGYYVVRVPPTGSYHELLSVVERLDSMQGVSIAAPWIILTDRDGHGTTQ